MGTNIWTEERLSLLRELRLSGKSYKQIGIELGVNRNSVASRLRRLGMSQKQVRLSPEELRRRLLARREKYNADKRAKRAAAGAKPKPAIAKLFDIALPSPPFNLDLLELRDHHCRFAYGESTPYLFCGHNVVEGSSWCPAHFRICTTPPRPRTDSRPFPRAA